MDRNCEITIQNGLPIGNRYPSLMQSILLYTNFNIDEALDLYGVTLLDEFKEIGIENPTLDNILSFVEQDNINESKELNKKDKQLLLDISLQNNQIENIKQRFLDAFNINGRFGINTDKLRDSGLFSDSDILYLIDSNNLKDIQNLYYKLNKTDENIEGIGSDVIIKGELLSKRNPDEFLQNSYDFYLGLNTRQEILDRASDIGDETINQNPSLADIVLRQIQGKQGLVQYETDEYNGEIKFKENNNQLTRLEQTLDITQDFTSFMAQLEYIKEQAIDTYVQDLPLVSYFIKNLTKQASDLGIDITNLPDTFENKNHAETIDFLDSLYNFLYDVQNANDQDITESMNEYTQAYNLYFGIEPESNQAVVDSIGKDGVFLHLETNKSQEQLFKDNSILKVRDNIYQKITDDNTIEDLYQMFFENPNLLPRETYSVKVNEINKDIILDDIDQYISVKAKEYLTENSDVEAVKKMTAYKILFGLDNINQQEIVTGRIELDAQKFLVDFNKEILKNPYLQNIFYFSNRGLDAKQVINEYTSRQLRNNMSESKFSNLIKYAKLSNNESLSYLKSLENDDVIAEDNLRDYYANNPTMLSLFDGTYYKENGYIVADSNEDYLKINNQLYENVAPNVYAKVETNDRYINSGLNKPNYDGSIIPNIKLKEGGRVTIKKASEISDDSIEFC